MGRATEARRTLKLASASFGFTPTWACRHHNTQPEQLCLRFATGLRRVPWRLAAYWKAYGEQAVKDAGLMPAMEALRAFFEKEASRSAGQVIWAFRTIFTSVSHKLVHQAYNMTMEALKTFLRGRPPAARSGEQVLLRLIAASQASHRGSLSGRAESNHTSSFIFLRAACQEFSEVL